jgi:porphobilinogen synthase
MSETSTRFFPFARMRRNRKTDWSRRLVREKELSVNNLILSLIVHDRDEPNEPIASMPNIVRHNLQSALETAKQAQDLGIPMIAVFPHISADKKDETGEEALNPDGIIIRFLKEVKKIAPNIGIMCDVALDPYTTHGHDGIIDDDGYMLNDETTAKLIEQAILQAKNGADVVAPSDMCDGRIGAIRGALEMQGLVNTQIMSYAAKYASAFYGPYRDAIGSKGALKGDKKTYQMDPMNAAEALHEVALDIHEGADLLMVKPGMPYLDIVAKIKNEFQMPTYVFQVSGEYAMQEAAIANGWLDGNRARLETLQCFVRAGADGIITYWALEAAKILGGK